MTDTTISNQTETEVSKEEKIQEILDARTQIWEEKRDRKEERYTELAEKHGKLSDQYYKTSKQISDMIPFGQPILVGHHSEKRHRRDADRIYTTMGKSVEHSKTEEYYQEKLHNLQSNTAISSDDPQAIPKLEKKLAGMEECHQQMKDANKIINSKKLDDNAKIEKLKELGLGEKSARELLSPDYCGRIGYPGFTLTNNNAGMRQVKKRIEELKASLLKAAEAPTEDVEYDGFTLIRNGELNRIQLVFDGKPSSEIRDILKYHGFRWSPSKSAWQRQLNGNGEFAAKQVIKKLESKQ